MQRKCSPWRGREHSRGGVLHACLRQTGCPPIAALTVLVDGHGGAGCERQVRFRWEDDVFLAGGSGAGSSCSRSRGRTDRGTLAAARESADERARTRAAADESGVALAL